jgi:predicted Co/Zn/Cd cation transporter (cation efflux family)
MTAVDGLLIMAICAGSIVGSVQDIVHPEPVRHVEAIIIYSFISIFICIGFGLYMKSIGDRISSELLKADSQLWIIEGIVSAGVCLAFAVFDVISYSVWSGYANYVDPIMSIILCLGLPYEPLKIVWGSFQDLVDARPDDEANERIEAVVHRMAEKYYLPGVAWIKTRKAGRKRFLTVCYKIEPTRNIKEMEEIRNDMENEVRQTAPEMDVDVHFRS